MNLIKEIPELVEKGVITQETAGRINDYYLKKHNRSPNKLLIVFSILGAILTGLGIILIIAHNWDEFSRTVKIGFAFLPLLTGQSLCMFSLLKKTGSDGWRESSASFLFFAVGASISIISQVYNLSGSLSFFLLTWMLLCLPVVYVMRSSVTSLLYITGITYYAAETVYFVYPQAYDYYYWLLLAAVLPYYLSLAAKRPNSNFTIFHNWLIPLSLTICLGIVAKHTEELLFVAYMSLFGVFYIIAGGPFFQRQKAAANGYLTIGSFGTVTLLLFVSFSDFWERLRNEHLHFSNIFSSPEFITAVLITVIATALLYWITVKQPAADNRPAKFIFLLFLPLFVIGTISPIAVVLANLLVLAFGVLTIRNGAKTNHLGILNYGLLIISALILCRFFDTDLSFAIRGTLFVLVGLGFFFTNFRIIKKRKQHAQQ